MDKIKITLVLIILTTLLSAEENKKTSLTKTSIVSATYFDINRITMAVKNNGVFANDPETLTNGFWYDDVSLIWTSGLWLAAKVDSQVRA